VTRRPRVFSYHVHVPNCPFPVFTGVDLDKCFLWSTQCDSVQLMSQAFQSAKDTDSVVDVAARLSAMSLQTGKAGGVSFSSTGGLNGLHVRRQDFTFDILDLKSDATISLASVHIVEGRTYAELLPAKQWTDPVLMRTTRSSDASLSLTAIILVGLLCLGGLYLGFLSINTPTGDLIRKRRNRHTNRQDFSKTL
jgi:hypothetical protein